MRRITEHQAFVIQFPAQTVLLGQRFTRREISRAAAFFDDMFHDILQIHLVPILHGSVIFGDFERLDTQLAA